MGNADTKINRGSEWRKWDLHVHTPDSHTSEYPGKNNDEKWENFIKGLEGLPTDIKVIGINDYLFLEGYKKVIEYKKDGRLENIDLILPVIEFRLKEFAGHEELSKINYHIIFAEQSILDIDTIEAQFLSCFRSACNLDEKNASNDTWAGVVTIDSIVDLGQAIYDATPKEKRESDNPFEIGFNNISYSLEKLEECLGERREPNTYLEGKYIKAIGRSEWEDFRWTGSPSNKKDIINSAHLVFSASPDVEQANKNINSLKKQLVNSRLLHCSDAHTIKQVGQEGVPVFAYSKTESKELGHCFSWIKGDPSFETLRQMVVDYENRVLIQERNPSENKNSSPEFFIDYVEYKQNSEIQKIYLNKDINAVIGKRGAGKSVLLKHIAFDILKEQVQPVVKRIEKLQDFKVHWCDSSSDNKFVEYIPQNYLSAITYEDGEEYDDRDKMLRERLFNNESFKNADQRKMEIVDSIESKISSNIKEILSIHQQIVDTKNQLKPLGEIEGRKNAIATRQEEIKKLGKINIADEDIQNQTTYSSEIVSLIKEIRLLEDDIQIIMKTISRGSDMSFITVHDEAFFGLSQMTLQKVEEQIEKLSTQEIKTYLKNLCEELVKKKKIKEEEKSVKEDRLKPINEKLQQNKTIEKILKEINKLENEKKEIEELNNFIQESTQKEESLITEVIDLYLSFKENIEVIVQTLKDKFSNFTFITFDFTVSYDINNYEEKFFEIYIDGRSGDRFKKVIDEKRDFNKDDLIGIIRDIVADADTAKLKRGADKESTLVALLSCRYDIDFTKSVKYKNGEDLVSFENMTGGQKAMALLDLIFNLSKSGYPIIIDQPENDIDVSGISNDLKEFILNQKEKRQVIIATHSPNLLLLTDSENIVVAENEDNTINYHNGGIEDIGIQEDIVIILEGGGDALGKRMLKLNVKGQL